jgi:formamidopyrimidine-DNA glycosylase
MPELPEVETVVRALRPLVAGRAITALTRVDAPAGPKYAGLPRAIGARIDAVERRGKFIVMRLSTGDLIAVHLGMTGTLSPTPPPDHVRVRLDLVDAAGAPSCVYFRDPRRFGRFVVAAPDALEALPTLASMGPEPFDPAFTAAAFAAALARRRGPIKPLLLGQRVVAGLGNIYADEALFAAAIHPACPAHRVPVARVRALHAEIQAVLTRAIAARGTTLRDYRDPAGDSGGFAVSLRAYGREGAPCDRCQTPLEAFVLGARTTTFCPRCQRLPRAPRQ